MQSAKNLGVTSLVVQGHSPLIHLYLQSLANDKSHDTTPKQNSKSESDNNSITNQKDISSSEIKTLYQQILNQIQNDFDAIQIIYIPKQRNEEANELAINAVRTQKSMTTSSSNINLSPPPSLHFASFNDDIREQERKNEKKQVERIDPQSGNTMEERRKESVDSKQKDTNSQKIKSNQSLIDPKSTYILRFDGGSRGNPGVAGAGFVLYKNNAPNDREIFAGSFYIGTSSTNNEAEYIALQKGLEYCESIGIQHVEVQGDSSLVVKQVQGQWKCKKDHLRVFLRDIQTLMRTKFKTFNIEYIPRAHNARADELANLAMDSRRSNL